MWLIFPSTGFPKYSYYRLYIIANGGASYAIDGATRDGAKTLAFSAREGELQLDTSNGQCTASATDASQGSPETAFVGAGVVGTIWSTYRTSSPAPPAWLQYRFDAAQELVWYHVESSENPNHAITGWRFEGSADGSFWVTLDTQSGQDTAGKRKTYLLCTAAAGSSACDGPCLSMPLWFALHTY